MATAFTPGPNDDPALGLSWLIERAGQAVGYVVLTFADPEDRGARRAYLSGLYVRPELRGQGIGELARRFVQDVGRSLGCRVLAAGIEGESKEPRSPRLRSALGSFAMTDSQVPAPR